MSEVAGTSPATTRLAELSQSFRSLLLARLGNFLAPAKKPLVIGILQTRFLTLSYSHFDLKPAADQSPTPGLERMLSTFLPVALPPRAHNPAPPDSRCGS